MKAASHCYFAPQALLPEGWRTDVLLRWNDTGILQEVTPDSERPEDVPKAKGPVIPGMTNLHSHAFQRAFAGLTEYGTGGQDNFWSWRNKMYQFANAITPGQLEAVAAALYVEMLEAGYTGVCEFHYVHHDTDGKPYADDATLSTAILNASAHTGIGLTLLPVLYQTGGFGGTPPSEGQRRFIRRTENMIDLLSKLAPVCRKQGARLGLAPHSLRAVPPESLKLALEGLNGIDPAAPFHIHIAEQTAEVEACLAFHGQRPVKWLLENMPVNERWCLIHATHMTREECEMAARSGAVAGLCPATEANLGDGIFDLVTWRDVGGVWGVGSDSHCTVNAAEELLILEYGQRLKTHRRNVAAGSLHPSVATAMTTEAVSGGARASGRPVAGLAVGQSADWVMLDAEHYLAGGLPNGETVLSAHVFASHRQSIIDEVRVAGRPLVKQGRHAQREKLLKDFTKVRAKLLEKTHG